MGMKREQLDYAAYPQAPVHLPIGIDADLGQHEEIPSQYVGVSWFRPGHKWRSQIQHEGKMINVGYFDKEIEAARAVNAKCKELGIPVKNPGIEFLDAPIDFQNSYHHSDENYPIPVKYEVKREAPPPSSDLEIRPKKKRKRASSDVPKSQYKCVSWYRSGHKWRAQIRHNGKMLNVGYFNNELDAAKAVNFKCAELNRPMKNPGLGILQPNSTKVQSENKRLQQQVYRIEKEKQELQLEVIKLKEEIHLLKKLISTDHNLNNYLPLSH